MKGHVHLALKLAHHRHTAKPLPHHHTSYRALFVVLGVVGLTMATIQYASADNYTVTAVVPGDTLTAPAVITSPANGVVVNSPTIDVRGTCQVVDSGTYVTIVRGAESLGTAQCKPDSTFLLNLTLSEGGNVLTTTVVSGSNGSGPDGAGITVTYVIPPVQPATGDGATSPLGAMVPVQVQAIRSTPRVLTIRPQGSTFVQRSLDKLVVLVFTVEHGATPYTVEADWGDGKTETIRQAKAGVIRLQHMYDMAGSYVVTLRAIDAKGQKATFQSTVLAQAPLSISTPSIASPTIAYGQALDSLTLVTRAVWASYGLVSFAIISLWLVSPTHSLLVRPIAVKTKVVRRMNHKQ